MRILIIGMGAAGSAMAYFLAADPRVSEVVCADRDLARAGKFLRSMKKKRLIRLDAADTAAVVRAARGVDLIINAGLPDFNEPIMEAALSAGADYQDLCSHLLDLRHAEQLKFQRRFARAGLRALINTGVAPGVTNLMARELADKFDRLDSIRIRLLEDQDAETPVNTWSPAVIIDEITSRPLVFRKGRFGLTEAFSEAEEREFPAPFGRRRVMSIYGDEVATLPLFLKVRNVDMKAGGTDIEFAAALNTAGLLSKRPVPFRGARIVPAEFFASLARPVPAPREMIRLFRRGVIRNARFAALVEAEGRSSGRGVRRVMTAVFPDMREIMRRRPSGSTYISYPTAAAAVALTHALVKLDRRGVFPPEVLDKKARRSVFSELSRRGVVFGERAVRR